MIKKVFFILLLIPTTNLIECSSYPIQSSSYPLILTKIWGEKINSPDVHIFTHIRQKNEKSGWDYRLNINLYHKSTKTNFSDTNKEEIISLISASKPRLIKYDNPSYYDITINDFIVGRIPSHITQEFQSIALNLLLDREQVPNFFAQMKSHLNKAAFEKNNYAILTLGTTTSINQGNIQLINDPRSFRLCLIALNTSDTKESLNILPETFSETTTIKSEDIEPTITPIETFPTEVVYYKTNESSEPTQSTKVRNLKDETNEIPQQLHWLQKTCIIAVPFALIGLLLFINKHLYLKNSLL